MRRERAAFAATVAAVVGTALFQNFFRLARAPVLSDEPLYAEMGWRYVHWGSLSEAARSSPASNFEHPPLAKLLFGLAQLVAGSPSLTAARAVGAVCTVVAASVLGWWVARVAGRWAGLLAGGMLALLPATVLPQVTPFGRTAMLDPVAELFMVLSVVGAWFWFTSSGRRSWVLAIATGLAAGLAAASKENGGLGLVGPVVLGLAWSHAPTSALRTRLAQAAAVVMTAGSAFVCCYLPFGDPVGRIAYLYAFQTRHSRVGHLIGLDGEVTTHPAWWANLYFAGLGMGLGLAVLVALTAVAAVVLRRDRMVAWCAAALAVPFVFHAFVADVVLPFYWVMWMPMVVALSALGTAGLCTAAVRSDRRWQAGLAGLVAVVGLIGTVVPVVRQTATVAQLRPVGPAAVADVRERLGLHGVVLATGIPVPEMAPYLPASRILLYVPENLSPVDTVLIGQPRCRTPLDPGIRALIDLNLETRSLRLARVDRLLLMYVTVGRLHVPTPGEIAAEPPTPLAAHC